MKYEGLSKDALKCMYLSTLIGTVIGSLVLVVGYFLIKENIFESYFLILNIGLIVLGILMLFNLLISPKFRFQRYQYLINEEKIDIIEGYIWKKRVIVPVSRIHKITLNRGPIDTMFGLSKVTLTTAGGEAVIRFLKIDKALFIADKLKDKVNEVVGEE